MKDKILLVVLTSLAITVLGLGLYTNKISQTPISQISPDTRKSMIIPNDQGSLSSLSFILGDTGYIKVFSGITVGDVTNVWNDFCVFQSQGIFNIRMFINSPGGDAFAGLALANHIMRAKNDGFTITGYASGIVASAAVPIFAVCNERIAAPGTIFMVHETSIWKWPGRETHSDIISQGKLLNLLQQTYFGIMVDHSSLTAKEWGIKESKTSWFSAEEAKAWGLVDQIM